MKLVKELGSRILVVCYYVYSSAVIVTRLSGAKPFLNYSPRSESVARNEPQFMVFFLTPLHTEKGWCLT